jgi:NDP-sugar pyrophosphorylase family protein
MKAMVFAAGVGSRLKELTKDRPKCLMEVGGITMLERVVNRLKDVGVRTIAINLHHHPDQIEEFVRNKNGFGLEVVFSREQELLDTGGGLKRLHSVFETEDAYFVHNSDIFSDVDLGRLLADHRQHRSIGTLAVMRRSSSRGLFLDESSRLTGWTGEQNPPEGSRKGDLFPFCGISVASGELFQYMSTRDRFSLIEPYLEASRATGRVRGIVVDGSEWVDIGTPEQLQELRTRIE